MIMFLSWLVTGLFVGLVMRALAPEKEFLGHRRAVALGVAGAVGGGLAAAALLPGDPTQSPALIAWVGSVTGAIILLWLHMAYAVRWGVEGTRPAAVGA